MVNPDSGRIAGPALAVAAPPRRTMWDPGKRPTMDNPALLVLPATVHQAEGALVARLYIPVEDAPELLRAQAHEKGITVEEMADQVLDLLAGIRSNGHHTDS